MDQYPLVTNGAGTIEDYGVSRRRFLRLALVGTLGALAAEGVGAFLAFFWPRRTGSFGGVIDAGAVKDFPLNGTPVTNREGKFFISRVDEGFLAMYRKCTHLGCTIPDWNAQEERFHCPCHGSLFDRRGLVMGGPAPRPLDLMAVSVEGGRVLVNTGGIIQRADWKPKQAVKVEG